MATRAQTTKNESAGLLDRAVSNLRRAWREIVPPSGVRPDLPEDDLERIRRQVEACLEVRGGEVGARARAAELGRTYLDLSADGRARFLGLLAADYGCDEGEVDEATAALAAAQGPARSVARRRLRNALVPKRVGLLTQFNALPQGVKFLVDMRAELMTLARQDPIYRELDADLRELLVSWFDIGFLDLERLTWETPAALLEKLIDYEAVHDIRSWDDLKNRLDSDRRCFAFFHPRMPDEPLIFVEVALVKGMADNIHTLLDVAAPLEDPSDADTAIFYSISNAQAGLAGVSFGNFLIKRVVDELAREFQNLKAFATLSPIPGFRTWLDNAIACEGDTLLSDFEASNLVAASGAESTSAALDALMDTRSWHDDEEIWAALRIPLQRLAARYLLNERRGQRALDPVAHFHLSNGARLERINWLANTSPDGLTQSAGMMVNYLYRLRDIERYHEDYSATGRVAASAAVKRLLKG